MYIIMFLDIASFYGDLFVLFRVFDFSRLKDVTGKDEKITTKKKKTALRKDE